ncbi:MAG: hypothetical protein PHR77_00600 [Kiritimatiellae bacterium]|nr:hypothetical protein [Kiritimatiellia bacterium]MDD5522918.1 hypothetical protein [Kiritimatiellia bacterium]
MAFRGEAGTHLLRAGCVADAFAYISIAQAPDALPASQNPHAISPAFGHRNATCGSPSAWTRKKERKNLFTFVKYIEN